MHNSNLPSANRKMLKCNKITDVANGRKLLPTSYPQYPEGLLNSNLT